MPNPISPLAPSGASERRSIISLLIALLVLIVLAEMFFSTLTFALREISRTRLSHFLKRRGREAYLDKTVEHADDLAFITALFRLLCNIAILLCILALVHETQWNRWLQYAGAFLIAGLISTLASVAIPLALARQLGSAIVGVCIRPLWALRTIMAPAVNLMAALHRIVGHAAGPQTEAEEHQEIEDQILTAVEAGEKEGLVDEQEREMIQSVIEFGDATARQVMTARPDIVALDAQLGLTIVREVFEKTGHSRIPVYEDSLDHIIGVLYARDLLKYVGETADTFDIRKVVRPAFFVPETKLLRDLLRDFRLLKVHMAIVLDEYGAAAGLVTIEDVLEQLVGEISDEHEPQEPDLLRKLDDHTWEVDARLEIAQLNAHLPITLPEDELIRTIGGYVSTTVGRIPESGALFSLPGMRVTILDAEPQRINRLRIEILPDDHKATP